MANPNIEMLSYAVARLQPLLNEIVFLGGCVTGLLVSDPAAGKIKVTSDVDVLVEVSSLLEYQTFSKRLRELGFAEDTSDDAPVCRWTLGSLILDVMPTDENILGFGNRWYPAAIANATTVKLESGYAIRVVTAPLFLATKIEAFHGRGKGDFLGSTDLEDIVSILDGRPQILEEIATSEREIRDYLKSEFSNLNAITEFRDAIPGHLEPDSASQARLGPLMQKIKSIIESE